MNSVPSCLKRTFLGPLFTKSQKNLGLIKYSVDELRRQDHVVGICLFTYPYQHKVILK